MRTQTERKRIRMQQRKQKKIKKHMYYTKNNPEQVQKTLQNTISKHPKTKQQRHQINQHETAVNQDHQMMEQYDNNDEDEMIKYYEHKLKVDKKGNLKQKMATSMGYDGDLFDFLDNIGDKVKKANKNRSKRPKQQANKHIKQQTNKQSKQQASKHVIKPKQEMIRQPVVINGANDVSCVEIRRRMTGLFNKLSEGNIVLTIRQMLLIFNEYPRAETVPIFVQIFIKCNVLIEKLMLHVQLTNIALAVGLHSVIGDRLMYLLVYDLTHKFHVLSSTKDDPDQLQYLGYSKNAERIKNFIIIICYLYEYGSLSGQYIISVVRKLAQQYRQDNRIVHVELLYLIMRNVGVNIRQNNPSLFKEIIVTLKDILDAGHNQHQKIKYLQIQINQLKFNRRKINEVDHRMTFLRTFIFKIVPKQLNTVERTPIDMDMQQMLQADITHTNWWQKHPTVSNGQIQQEVKVVISEENSKLLQMAKILRLTTEIRKTIFMEIMQSHDYIEATQRILQLKVKQNQNVATVIIEICLHQGTFNPYYALIAAKLCNLDPKFRQHVQYALWDHLKLLEQYSLRKISNLGKFVGWFLSSKMSNGSLSILKFFPDLCRLRQQSERFLVVCLKQFFRRVQHSTLIKVVSKLKEQNNYSVKVSLKQYLGEMEQKIPDNTNKKWVKMLNVCRRILMLQDSNDENDEV